MVTTREKWSLIKHTKTPTKDYEIFISDILENFVVAVKYKNIEYLSSVILNDAIFISDIKKTTTKDEYLNEVNKMVNLRKLEYLNVSIEIINDIEADVFFIRHVIFKNYKETFSNRCIKLIKHNNVWKISKTIPSPKHLIKFTKHPETKDEIDISETLKKIIVAYSHKDYNYIDAIILDDAIFINDVGEIINKTKHIYLNKKSAKLALEYLNVSIEIKNNYTANIFLIVHIILTNNKETFSNRCIKLIKHNNVWKISKNIPNNIKNISTDLNLSHLIHKDT